MHIKSGLSDTFLASVWCTLLNKKFSIEKKSVIIYLPRKQHYFTIFCNDLPYAWGMSITDAECTEFLFKEI